VLRAVREFSIESNTWSYWVQKGDQRSEKARLRAHGISTVRSLQCHVSQLEAVKMFYTVPTQTKMCVHLTMKSISCNCLILSPESRWHRKPWTMRTPSSARCDPSGLATPTPFSFSRKDLRPNDRPDTSRREPGSTANRALELRVAGQPQNRWALRDSRPGAGAQAGGQRDSLA
jgi:hypothetical protein